MRLSGKKCIVGSIALAALCSLIFFAVRVYQIGDGAERQLMAIHYVNVACTDYVAAKHNWPHSWEDLEKCRPSVGHVTLPRDFEWVQRAVRIDFHTDLKQISTQTTSTFTGFGPVDESAYKYSYDGVIEAARNALPKP